MLLAPPPNRRDALKALHRQAILAAAAALVAERGGPGFTVDLLAERADVARRTVFNHFTSLDEILVTLCVDALDVLVDEFVAVVAAVPLGNGGRASMFDEIAVSLRACDLPSAIAHMVSILGTPGTDQQRESNLSDRAFTIAAGSLLAEVLRRHPDADEFDAELMVGSLMNGVIVCARHWIQFSGVRVDSEGRAEWQRLLDRLISSMRSGY
jgi:TetR/AcrR family transcriptional regulator of autoinduction and epiphytic fitness